MVIICLEIHSIALTGRAKLQWVTNSGFKTDYFAIERMDEKGEFKTLETQNAETKEGLNVYTFTD